MNYIMIDQTLSAALIEQYPNLDPIFIQVLGAYYGA